MSYNATIIIKVTQPLVFEFHCLRITSWTFYLLQAFKRVCDVKEDVVLMVVKRVCDVKDDVYRHMR